MVVLAANDDLTRLLKRIIGFAALPERQLPIALIGFAGVPKRSAAWRARSRRTLVTRLISGS